MSKISVCLEPLFEDLPFYNRIALAKECGADAIEFWDASPYDLKRISDEASKHDLPIAVITMNQAWQHRLDMDYEAVQKNAMVSFDQLEALGCKKMIGLSGEIYTKTDSQKTLLIENLKRLSEELEKRDVTLVVEALNSIYDHKGYYLDSSYVGFEIVKAVNSTHVKLLFDIYHMQLMEGNLINNIETNIGWIGHFHSAGVPGRNEHMNCEVNYPAVVKRIEDAGYDQYLGLEYWPTFDHKTSLTEVIKYLRS